MVQIQGESLCYTEDSVCPIEAAGFCVLLVPVIPLSDVQS